MGVKPAVDDPLDALNRFNMLKRFSPIGMLVSREKED